MKHPVLYILIFAAGYLFGVLCCFLILHNTGTKPRHDRRRPALETFEIVPPREVIENEIPNEN